MASKTGWVSVRDIEIARKISDIAVCCARTSFRALVSCAYESDGGPVRVGVLTGAAHSTQKFACGGFSCWHWGHFMPPPERAGSRAGLTVAWGARRRQWPSHVAPSFLYRTP